MKTILTKGVATIFFTLTLSTQLISQAEWTIVFVKQACNDLESFMYRNIRDMMKHGSTNDVNILLELHKPGDCLWRYKIEKGFCAIEQTLTRSRTADIAEELESTMEWAVRNYPAKQYGLVLSNHGSASYDPKSLETNTYLNNVKRGQEDTEEQPSRMLRNIIPSERGILFDTDRRLYLSTDGLQSALSSICKNLLDGKKLALLGMDACLMGCMEVMYQVKNFADHYIASQEYELAQGWGYDEIIKELIDKVPKPEELGKIIVEKFEDRYKNYTSYFTQSHIALEYMDDMKKSLDTIATLLMACKKESQQRVRSLIHQARCQCLSFSIPDLIDLHSFFEELTKLLATLQYGANSTGPSVRPELLTATLNALEEGKRIIKESVKNNRCGRYLRRAEGISIYFPLREINPAYTNTQLARESCWMPFVVDHLTVKGY